MHSTRSPIETPQPTSEAPVRRRTRWLTALLAGILLTLILLVGIYLTTAGWLQQSISSIVHLLLRVRIIDGAFPVLVLEFAVLALLFLVARKWTIRRAVTAAAATVAGAIVAVAALWFVTVTVAFGVQLSLTTSMWVIATFSVTGLAIASFWSASWLRRLGGTLAIMGFVLAGIVGVNADFGLNPTLGALLGVSTQNTIALPSVLPTSSASPTPTILARGALWANWHAPAGMPSHGTVGQIVIPNTRSHFKARPAGLYLPPAALVQHPPPLPLVVMMMGQPGNPDPSFTQAVLDRFAARHHGLAPIVVVADQIGYPAVDPLCLNTARYGNAETYIEGDVVEWARTHLNVLQDAAHWTIAGYSNGGECALYFGAKYPTVWGNVLDISGEQYPGAERSTATPDSVFNGDVAAYEATWPQKILEHGHYPDTVGIFTVGSNDDQYRREAMAVVAYTTAAKWKTTYFEVLKGGHILGALNGGLAEGYRILYPRLGLTEP